MSDVATPAHADPYTKLRDTLATIKAPSISPEEVATRLDNIWALAIGAEQMAASPANDLDTEMHTALTVELTAGDAADCVRQVIGNLEQFERQIRDMGVAAKAALRDAMVESGTQTVEGLTHEAKQKRPGRRVVITDEKALPLDVFSQPKVPAPKPSKDLIKAHLLVHGECPGAAFEDSEPEIDIKAKGVPSR